MDSIGGTYSERPGEQAATTGPTSSVYPLALIWVLALTFMLQLNNLDHTALLTLDECCHAVVARNVFKHPLVPTLIDGPYLPYNAKGWSQNHVWLHKPILPFWQIALSFAVHGVSAFALRLPLSLIHI